MHLNVMSSKSGKIVTINKWDESIKKIPQKDEFELEGIKTWRISKNEMIPNYTDMRSQLFREEAIKLIACGFDLAFNTDYGVGYIRIIDNGFVIELWQNKMKTEISKNTLDGVIDWLIFFYNIKDE